MSYQKQKFAKNGQVEFFTVLRQRVVAYFERENRSSHANSTMMIKTVVMFLLYFTPYLVLLFAGITHPLAIIGLWVMMGFGMAGIGLTVMHDANHGAYSAKKWVNKLLGYSLNLVGANAEIWKLQHNRLHHTYTNIEGTDEDINTPAVLRFSPHKKRLWVHRFQFLYVWFFYGLSTLSWVTAKEFVQLFRYRKGGLISSRKKFRQILAQLIVGKLLYYMYILVLPILLMPVSGWLILLSFFIMHFTTGLILSMIFQTAHVMPSCAYPMPDEDGVIENSWAIHEMMTTTNYAPSSRIFTWLVGGLNFQVEHHLFPKVCHVHYSHISKIVAATAKEYDVPYHSQKTFLSALWSHTKMLYELGRWEPAVTIR